MRYVKVKSVEPTESVPVYHMTIRHNHNFFANKMCVHNCGYRGEIMLRFSKSHEHYNIGEKIGQLIILPYPQIHLEEVEELSSTDRGVGGFGSTGK